MNFDNDTPVDTLIGKLLAFVIMFERKLEHIKCRLAGNQQFHTRVAFQVLDLYKKNEIVASTLCSVFRNWSVNEQESSCQLFLRRYSKNGALTYDEFLKLIVPKSNKTLSQRMLIRTHPKGAKLDEYLNGYLMELLTLYTKMTSVTESLRTTIQQNDSLTQLDLIEFFHQRMATNRTLFDFLQRSTPSNEQYDISLSDMVYLTYHVQSGNDIEDFTDIDIKEILCPLDMNHFQKRLVKQIFQQTAFPKETQYTTQTANFLGKTYQKMYDRQPVKVEAVIKPQNNQFNFEQFNVRPDRYTAVTSTRPLPIPEKVQYNDQSYGALYIDNFSQPNGASGLQLNHLLGNQVSGHRPYEVFQDDLNSNNSSASRQSESAFDRS